MKQNKGRKSIWLLIMVLVLTLVVAGCGSKDEAGTPNQEDQSNNDGKVYNIKLTHVFPSAHAVNITAEKYAELVDERTNGRVKISIFPNGVMGGDREIGEALQRGSLEMAISNQGVLAVFDPKMELTGMIQIDSFEKADKYLYDDGWAAQKTTEIAAESGFVILNYLENEFRHMTNSVRPIEKIEDFKGLKFRVPESPVLIDLFTKLGAQPTPIPFPELYTALQQGTVDGQENGVLLTTGANLHEVQKYVTYTYHGYSTASFMLSKKFWDTLPEDIQQVMQETADEMSKFQRDLNRSNIDAAVQKMKDAGIQFSELTPEAKAKLQEIQAGQVDSHYRKRIGDALVDEALANIK